MAQESAPPSGSPEVVPYLNGLSPEERLAVLEREAKREGSVVVYGALGIDRANVFISAFNKRYPDIKVDFVRLREPELVERVNLEVNAGRPGGDLIISNVPWLDQLKDVIVGYVPTTWDSFADNYRFGSAEEDWTAIAYEALPSTIAWRTDRVSADEAPHSLADLTDPKWKGRLGTTRQIEALIDGLDAALGEEKAAKLVDQLAAQQNRIYPSMASLADALSSGNVDVVWNIGGHRPTRLKAQGAPIDFVMQDPLLALGITVSLVKGAPNTYAAALLMEFITEPETLEALDQAEGGRIFGVKDANFSIDTANLPPVTFFRPIDPDRFADLAREAEGKFLRQ
ncbi:ABC transporter substrate-binding protein [Afifella sp. IM 167]|uniref:ABC transporter substrate-binding protein n=1 Tax=Afifella sp. IM 167 TaxID=2033586 RepID=UPI001CCC8117|nr:extracellular solute-binding protein [Afifella sp. IM 167]